MSRGGAPISLVYLVRVRVGDDAPYVVVDADAPDGSLTLDQVPTAPGGPVTACGTLAGPARLDVQLRAPGSDRVLSRVGEPVARRRLVACTCRPGRHRRGSRDRLGQRPRRRHRLRLRPVG